MQFALHFLTGVLFFSAPTAAAVRVGVTAVVLNWARLHNVVGIVRNLCSPSIADVVRSVVVWNNNPRLHLTRHHFSLAACPLNKLVIVNSPVNVYFQARFLACSDATTELCFLQDDDYLVRVDVIRSLSNYLNSSANTSAVHLLPPHEYLTTGLRSALSHDNTVHTGFAWLGYGTLLRRSAASAFLELVNELRLSEWEMKMVDNYYTILSNSFPMTWMDDGTPLDGTGAFTVGTEGDERNWDHIARALKYLRGMQLTKQLELNPLQTGNGPRPSIASSTAVCIGAQCTLTTNINSLPLFPISTTPFNMRTHEQARRRLLGQDTAQKLLTNPLSHAVDMSNSSAFVSIQPARRGDYLVLDILSPATSQARVSIGVDDATRNIINGATFELSQDNSQWVPLKGSLECGRACLLTILDTDWRWLRILVTHDMQEHWKIYDIRMHHVAEPTNVLA